jgi:hypothetical protein
MVHISFCFILLILCRSIHTIKEKTEALVATNEEIGVEVNGDKTKSTWLCTESRMQCKITMYRLMINPLKGWDR